MAHSCSEIDTSPLYYRDSHVITPQYGNRRVEIAEILGKQTAAKLVARLQALQKTEISATRTAYETPQQQRA